MSERLEQIRKLNEQIFQLQEEDKLENQAKILPFIRDGKVMCNFEGHYNHIFITVDKSNERELIGYIKGKQDGGWNHFGCPISEMSEIRYDDGRIHIYFKFSGSTSELKDKFLAEIKFLGIKVDFTDYKQLVQHNIELNQKKMVDAVELEIQLS